MKYMPEHQPRQYTVADVTPFGKHSHGHVKLAHDVQACIASHSRTSENASLFEDKTGNLFCREEDMT